MRSRAYRRHQTHRHMMRRLKEDWNQHYDRPNYIDGEWIRGQEPFSAFSMFTTLTWVGSSPKCCPCFTDAKTQARFKEQPAYGRGLYSSNPRNDHRNNGHWPLTLQELRYTRQTRKRRVLRPIDEWDE